MRWRSPPETDDEYIERIRKLVKSHDRWKRWSAPLVVLVALSPVVMLVLMMQALVGFLKLLGNAGQPNIPLAWVGFGFGALLGLGLGQHVHSAMMNLFQFFTGQRTERLLVRYYDAFQSSLDEPDPTTDSDGAES